MNREIVGIVSSEAAFCTVDVFYDLSCWTDYHDGCKFKEKNIFKYYLF